jgi:hypothetical protein
VSKSLLVAFKATLCGCVAGVGGGLFGGLVTCWPFAGVCGVFGGAAGTACGIPAGFVKRHPLAWAITLGLASGLLTGVGFGVYLGLYGSL